jgi:hypothetical protein
VLTILGYIPIVLILPTFLSLVEGFVVVSHSGMLRQPKIVAKVYRNGRTRKSLRVLKLLSSMKGAAKGTKEGEGPKEGKGVKVRATSCVCVMS